MNDMKEKKYVAHVLFGESACNNIVDESVREFKRCAKKFDGQYNAYEFHTEAERDAFILGISEGNGWQYYDLFYENK